MMPEDGICITLSLFGSSKNVKSVRKREETIAWEIGNAIYIQIPEACRKITRLALRRPNEEKETRFFLEKRVEESLTCHCRGCRFWACGVGGREWGAGWSPLLSLASLLLHCERLLPQQLED